MVKRERKSSWRKIVLIGLPVLLLIVGGYYGSGLYRAKQNQMIVELTYDDNQLDSKDPYREIHAQNSINGKVYLIEATGSSKPAPFGTKCVSIPNFKQGQRIKISLPEARDLNREQFTVLTTCYRIFDPAAPWYHFGTK